MLRKLPNSRPPKHDPSTRLPFQAQWLWAAPESSVASCRTRTPHASSFLTASSGSQFSLMSPRRTGHHPCSPGRTETEAEALRGQGCKQDPGSARCVAHRHLLGADCLRALDQGYVQRGA